jgi:hypothetical protein
MTSGHQSRTAFVPLGRLLITKEAMAVLSHGDVFTALRRHMRGDWGDLGREDQAANNQALHAGERLLSSYRSTDGVKFWIITEADRSGTTVLLPGDY